MMKRTLVLLVLLVLAVSTAACTADTADEPTGETTEALIDGTPTFERPEVGRLEIVTATGRGFCTGTLVAPQVVVTAAHCFAYGSGAAAGNYGAFHIKRSEAEASSYAIRRYTSFGTAQTSAGDTNQDVAVVELAGDVPAAVAVPVPMTADKPAPMTDVTIYGYGCTTRSNTSVGQGAKRKLATLAMLWNKNGTSNLCPGDSGGPAFDAAGRVIAVNSRHSIRLGWDKFAVLSTRLADVLATANAYQTTD